MLHLKLQANIYEVEIFNNSKQRINFKGVREPL